VEWILQLNRASSLVSLKIMRYSSLLVFLSLSLPLLPQSLANAQDTTAQLGFAQGFWRQAERLVQEQLNLINQIERTFYSPNVYQAEATRSHIFLHVGKVERFLKRQYQIPQFLCNNGTPDPDVPAPLTLPQRQVYCSLYVSTQKLEPMVDQLDRRLPMLAGLAAPSTVPLEDQRPGLRLNLATPLRPQFAPFSDFPQPEPPVLGMPTKRPLTDDQRQPLQPAIAPPEAVTRTLLAAREQLLLTVPAFPDSADIIDPGVYSVIPTQSTLGLLPLEPQRYADFLEQPNTGIARIFLAESYQPDPNKLRNRLQSPLPQPFPLTSNQVATDSVPSLTLEIENGNFTIPFQGLDYGFIVNLGDVSLDELDANLERIPTLTSEQRDLFLNYRPPNEVEALQIDQRRFYTGKDGIGFVPPLSPPAATGSEVMLENTYLVRLIQFQLPEAVLKREPISRSQRRYLPEILKTPSSDVIVAFQPVHQRLDGSYTVLWRLLYRFPDPQIENLAEYVELE